jgi:ribosomal-protein-alanine N-acetyltransferase
MFGFQRQTFAPSLHRIGAERSAECAEIHAESFLHPWSEADFEALLVAPETRAEGAIDAKSSRLIGFVLSKIAVDEAEILSIAVAPRWRKSGVGHAVLASHIADLDASGVKALFLEVDVENHAARTLYELCGFRPVGERKAYYRSADGGRASALIMRKDL